MAIHNYTWNKFWGRNNCYILFLGIAEKLFYIWNGCITFDLIWWRFIRRWWSIQQAIIRRMEFIESSLDLGANTYIAYLDQINCDLKPKDFNERVMTEEVKTELSQLANYECRGIQPILKFLALIISISWLLVLVILYYQAIILIKPDIILGLVLFIGLFLWFFFEIWDSP